MWYCLTNLSQNACSPRNTLGQRTRKRKASRRDDNPVYNIQGEYEYAQLCLEDKADQETQRAAIENRWRVRGINAI
jgi:hypothetical protein